MSWPSERTLLINNVRTLPAYRGRGLGSALFDALDLTVTAGSVVGTDLGYPEDA